ncbi:MAG: type II secretion system protein [Candidatus Omnitrophota bacterium]
MMKRALFFSFNALFGGKLWRIRPTKGFTLIEIITALAILVTGLVSILALFPVGFRASEKAIKLTEATIFAQEKMEEIKMKGYDEAVAEGKDDDGNQNKKLSREVAVSDVEEYEGFLKEVVVTVTWKERGRDVEEEFKTYVADYTP